MPNVDFSYTITDYLFHFSQYYFVSANNVPIQVRTLPYDDKEGLLHFRAI